MESEADEARSKLENCKYYTSLALGTLCIVCIFAFLFLVPFVLDPAISTLMHEFVERPVTCKVRFLIFLFQYEYTFKIYGTRNYLDTRFQSMQTM